MRISAALSMSGGDANWSAACRAIILPREQGAASANFCESRRTADSVASPAGRAGTHGANGILLAPVLHQEQVCVEVGYPLLALLRNPKIPQGIYDIGLNYLPKKLRVIYSQVGRTVEFQFIADSCLPKLVE